MKFSLPTDEELNNSLNQKRFLTIDLYTNPLSCRLPSSARANPLTKKELTDLCNLNVTDAINGIYDIDISRFGVCDKKMFNDVSETLSTKVENRYRKFALCQLYLIKYVSKENPSINIEELKEKSKNALLEHIKKEGHNNLLVNTLIVNATTEQIDDAAAIQKAADDFDDLEKRLAALNSGGSKSVKRRKTHKRKSIKRTRSIKRRGTKQRQHKVKRRRTKSRR